MQLLHLMIRVKDVDKSLSFFEYLGLKETRRFDYAAGRFTLIYLKDNYGACELELTHNWDQTDDYSIGNNFGHIAFAVENIYESCKKLQNEGAIISLPPRDGAMAFVKSPDGISIELLQKGGALVPDSYWQNQPNIGTW